MKKIFVDTSAFAALADKNDDNHQKAVTFNQGIAKTTLFTTNYILDELYTLLLFNAGYPKTITFKNKLDFMKDANLLRIVWIDESIEAETWKIFSKFNIDKEWSFTDCSSYVVMKENQITEAFTFDHHFSQMGFIQCPSL